MIAFLPTKQTKTRQICIVILFIHLARLILSFYLTKKTHFFKLAYASGKGAGDFRKD